MSPPCGARHTLCPRTALLPSQERSIGSPPALTPLFHMPALPGGFPQAPIPCGKPIRRHGWCPLPTPGASLLAGGQPALGDTSHREAGGSRDTSRLAGAAQPGAAGAAGARPAGEGDARAVVQGRPGWESGSEGSPAPTPSPGAASANILATRALAGRHGYFGSCQHHPERCPMLLFINPLAPAQLQPACMQEKAQQSQDKQSQQHPRTVGGNAERAKDAPAEPPSPGLPGGMDMPWHRGPGAGLQQQQAAAMSVQPPWAGPRVPGLPRSRWGAAGRTPCAAPSAGPAAQCQGPTCVAQRSPCPAQGAAELPWVTAELQPPWDPRDAGREKYLKYRLGLGPEPSCPRAERDANSRSSCQAAELGWPEVRVRVQPHPRGQRGCSMDGLPPGTGSSTRQHSHNWAIVSVPPATRVCRGIQQTRCFLPVPLAFPAQANPVRCPVSTAVAPQPARRDGGSRPAGPPSPLGTVQGQRRCGNTAPVAPIGPKVGADKGTASTSSSRFGDSANGVHLLGSFGITNGIIQKSKTTKGDQLAAQLTKAPCLEAPRAPQSPGENSI